MAWLAEASIDGPACSCDMSGAGIAEDEDEDEDEDEEEEVEENVGAWRSDDMAGRLIELLRQSTADGERKRGMKRCEA